ncbi:MAG: 16S rRNA (uracil(1498)-N(3))-methyltransferase [Clostridia bacterium]|nr:16S rRNA (uracil(1498)-N(3))-methyltransferase [Clostridia bacterium]
MPKFFLPFRANCQDFQVDDIIEITDSDASHISRTLRMKLGDTLTVNDSAGLDYSCVIDKITHESVFLKVLEITKCDVESDKKISLFQALVKSDKMDTVIQKAVELGVSDIYPVSAKRSVVRLDTDAEKKKNERWNKIALEASKQCGRGFVPLVHPVITVRECSELLSAHDLKFYCYETEDEKTIKDAIKNKDFKTLGFYIGPEGGVDPAEAELFKGAGIEAVSLGKLILRTETAGMAVLSMILYETRL